MEHYLGVARAEGIITEGEIGAIQSIVMAVSAGKISAQVSEVESKIKAGKGVSNISFPKA
jgi:hypothetical protein